MTRATPNPLQTTKIPTQHLNKNDAEGTITNVAATIDLHCRYPQRFSVAQQTQADGINGKLLVAWQLLALGYLKTIIAANNLDTAACAMHCNHDIFNPVLVQCAKTSSLILDGALQGTSCNLFDAPFQMDHACVAIAPRK